MRFFQVLFSNLTVYVFSDAENEEKTEETLDDLDEDELDNVRCGRMTQIITLHLTSINSM